MGDIQRIAVKGWVNKTLRENMADKSAQDILVLFSMILGEAVDEELIGSNPCRNGPTPPPTKRTRRPGG